VQPKRNAATIPLYLQISESLIREIAAGRLVTGDRLPPERVLAGQYGTTVRTLRKALSELEKNGLLERVQGSGNYVRRADQVQSMYSMLRLELHRGGGLPTARILDLAEMEKPSDLPDFGTSTRGTRFRRLRFMDGTPVAVEEIWLDGDSGRVDPALVSDSLYRFYKLHLGFWITRAEDRVSIGTVPDWAPAEFGKPAGTLTGYIERLSWAQAPRPVEFSRTWFDTDRALYIQRLT
jgi:GntR family transcriptional regulator